MKQLVDLVLAAMVSFFVMFVAGVGTTYFKAALIAQVVGLVILMGITTTVSKRLKKLVFPFLSAFLGGFLDRWENS